MTHNWTNSSKHKDYSVRRVCPLIVDSVVVVVIGVLIGPSLVQRCSSVAHSPVKTHDWMKPPYKHKKEGMGIQTISQTINLTTKQDDFFTSDKKYKAFIAGRGAGKTFTGCLTGLNHAFNNPGSLGVVVAPTYPMLRDSTMRTLLQPILLGDGTRISLCPPEAIRSFNDTKKELKLVNGSEILFRSADNPNSLRGPTISWFVIDEAAMTTKETWDILMPTLRQRGYPLMGAILTTPKGFDWIYEFFVKTPLPNSTVIYSTSLENQKNLPETSIEELKRSYSGIFYKQEVLGEFVGFEGLVYPEFSEQTHVISEAPGDFKRVIAGVDFGFTNPAAVIVIGLDGDGRAYLIDELYKSGSVADEFVQSCKSLKERHNISQFHCDPSEPAMIATMNRAGLASTGAKNDVMPGIMEVAGRFKIQADGRPRIYIKKNLINTITELHQYRYADTKEDKPIREEPLKVFDHLMDALRYALYSIKKQEVQLAGSFGKWAGW